MCILLLVTYLIKNQSQMKSVYSSAISIQSQFLHTSSLAITKPLEKENHFLNILLKRMPSKMRTSLCLLETDVRVLVKRIFAFFRTVKCKKTISLITWKATYSLHIFVEKCHRMYRQNLTFPVSLLGAYVYLAIYTLIIVMVTATVTILVVH